MQRTPSLIQPRLPLQSPVSGNIAIGNRRKIIFLYYSLELSGPSFQWALENIFRPGLDYVTLLSVFLDEAYTIVDTKKLWKLANEEISVEIEHKRKQERIEQEMEVFRMSLAEHDIVSQKVIMPEGDAKLTIVKLAQYTHAEMIVLSPLPINIIQKTIYGGLEDYLLKKGPCSVILAKPITGPYARRDSGLSHSPASASVTPNFLRNNNIPLNDVPNKPVSSFQNQEQNLDGIPEVASNTTINTTYTNPTNRAQEVSESLKKIEETGLSPALESIDLSTTTDQSSHPATEKDHEIDHEPMPASLVNFQQQLNEYQNRNSFSIEDDRDVWGKEDELSPTHPNYGFGPPLPNSPPLEVDSESEERSHDSIKRGENEMENAILSPNSEKSSYLNEEKDEKTNISNENVDEYPSISRTSSTNLPAFRPPQPQPKVKSIIDSLPNHAT